MQRTFENHFHRRLIAVSLLCVVSVIAGCSRPSGTGGGAVAFGGQNGAFGVDSAATIGYLNGLEFTIASLGDSVLVQKFKCTGCLVDSVRLMFIPEVGAYKADWKKAMTKDKEGYVVAAVLNVDNVTFADLGLEPGKLAYAWIGQTGATPEVRGFAVYRIDPLTGKKAATWNETTKVKHCDHDNTGRSKSSIKDKHPGSNNCVPIPISTAQNIFGPRAAYAATTAFQGIHGLWISCSGGCCEVGTD